MNSIESPLLRFAEHTLDVDRRSLKNNGRDIALRPQAMEVLCYLAKNPGRPVPKEEIFREVWSGLFVTDDSLVQCIADIRRALDDADHRIIKTVPRRGYLFAGVIGPGNKDNTSTTDAHRSANKSRISEIKLALIGAVVILAIWAMVHWLVSAH
jgi:DNA-binding winged helix-turn-helix (wHTH) protein